MCSSGYELKAIKVWAGSYMSIQSKKILALTPKGKRLMELRSALQECADTLKALTVPELARLDEADIEFLEQLIVIVDDIS